MYNSVNKLNNRFHKFLKLKPEIIFVVGTTHILKFFFKIIFSKNKFFLQLTGFGRLYTDYGLLGETLFNALLITLSNIPRVSIIVENERDKKHIKNLTNTEPFKINGSGFDAQLFDRLNAEPNEVISNSGNYDFTFGYISRFGKSKYTSEIIHLCRNLPSHVNIVIAGNDINGKKFSNEFRKLAEEKANIVFLGKLKSKQQVRRFFERISCVLYPSVREGLPMTLIEAIYFNKPFITTNVAGCDELAKLMGYPTLSKEEFCNYATLDMAFKKIKTTKIHQKPKCLPGKYLIKGVEGQFDKIIKTAMFDKN